MPLRHGSLFHSACGAFVIPLVLASCGHLPAPANPGNASESAAAVVTCARFQAEATAVLATSPDSISATGSVHHAHASAMAQYHACLAGH